MPRRAGQRMGSHGKDRRQQGYFRGCCQTPLDYNSRQYIALPAPYKRLSLYRFPFKSAMTPTRIPTPNALFSPLRQWALVALVLTGTAHADVFEDVTQLQRNGQLAEALARTNEHLSAKPRDLQMRFFKSVLQSDMGDKAAAIESLTEITQAHPELAEPYNNLAVLYASQRELDKARAALEMALRNNPGYAVAHENLGDIYAMLASQSYSQALSLAPDNAGASAKLTQIRQLLGPKRSKP